ncbi:MAG: RIO1 family regulatory kinase/ATPase [Candidatus Promineifilaceae bacterium]
MKFSSSNYLEEFEYLEEEFLSDQRRQSRRKGKRQSPHEAAEVRAALTDFNDNVDSWVPSYVAPLDPRHHERQWVIDSVGPFYRENIITDVVRLVKGGKEANVYACTAHPATGMEMIAAKLYRPRMLRNLKNDAVYKAGRLLRDSEGKELKKGRRDRLALTKKTAYGKKLDFSQWIGNEFRVQQMLYEAGARVPKPIAYQNKTIIMEYIGDEYNPAPALNEVRLPPEEAPTLFRQIMNNVALMLDHHYVHGDLSAYNVLYWNGRITLIDFPQMIEARHKPYAFDLLKRDITRVCEYFAKYGVSSDPVQLTLDLWEPYMGNSGSG